MTRRIGRLTLTGSLLACFGFAVLLVCSIPITSAEVVIDISFTVPPGSKYGPNDAGTGYHTRILGKSILEGEVLVEGGGIYVTAGFFNTQHVNNVYVDKQYNFAIDPANDLYVFVFDNTNGEAESLVRFMLKEVWTRPMAIGSPPLFILGLMGLVTFPMGLLTLVISHLRTRGLFKWKRLSLKMWAVVFAALFLLSNLRAVYFPWPDSTTGATVFHSSG